MVTTTAHANTIKCLPTTIYASDQKNTKFFVDDHYGIYCTIMVHTVSHQFDQLLGCSNIKHMTQGVKIAAVYICAITWLDNKVYDDQCYCHTACEHYANKLLDYTFLWGGGDLSRSYSTKLPQA